MPYACSQLKFGRIINSVGFSYSTESMFYTYIIVQAEILLKLNKMLTTVTDILKKIGKKTSRASIEYNNYDAPCSH